MRRKTARPEPIGLRWGRVEVSGFFLLWAAFFWYLGQEKSLLCWLAASCLHEMGHGLAAWLLGMRICRLRITVLGAELALHRSTVLSYHQELLVATAGPAVNLVTGVLAAGLWRSVGGEWLLLFAGASVILGVFNLLPLGPLDGGQLLNVLLSLLISPGFGRRAVDALTWAGGLILLGMGWRTFWAGGYNCSLLVIALWLLAGAAQKISLPFRGESVKMK